MYSDVPTFSYFLNRKELARLNQIPSYRGRSWYETKELVGKSEHKNLNPDWATLRPWLNLQIEYSMDPAASQLMQEAEDIEDAVEVDLYNT